MYHENIANPKETLVSLIKKNRKWYRNAELRLVIAKQNGQNILYRGKAVLQHKDDPISEEITHDYGTSILACRIFSIDELLEIIEKLPTETLKIKDLTIDDFHTDWETSIYCIPSRTRYLDVISDWPVKIFAYQAKRNIQVSIVNDYLVKPGLPTYHTFTDAAKSFLNLDVDYFNSSPYGLQFAVSDFRARIKTIEISEKNVNVNVDWRESNPDQLLIKFNAKNQKQEYVPDDVLVDSNTVNIEIPFAIKELYLFLVEKETGDVIDFIAYGNYMTDRHEGIIIRTSSDLVESLIANGENKNVEFKREFNKEEFLETVSSFANTSGGRIILGVDNRRNILGIFENFENLEKSIKGVISSRCEPQITLRIEQITVQNNPLIVITIVEGKDKPYIVKGKAPYFRVDDADIAMSRHELDQIYAKKQSGSRLRDDSSL